MSNKIITDTKLTREALRVLHNNIVFAKGVNRQYDSQFGVTGAKIGQTLNVRMPNQYYVSRGPALSPQGTNESFIPVTITTQWHVDTQFSAQELTLSLQDMSERIITPAMARLASQIDYDGLQMATYKTYNMVGTPGTIPGTSGGTFSSDPFLNYNSPNIFLNGGAMLDLTATPRDHNRRTVLGPVSMASSVGGLSGLFQDAGRIAEQYRKGVLGKALGFEFAMDQNVQSITAAAHGGTPVVYGASQTGAALLTSGWTANATVLMPGEIFTITGVYQVNPETNQSTGRLQQFVVGGYSVTAPNGQPVVTLTPVVADANGYATIPIYPSIIPAGATVANATVTASPAAGATLTLAFTASTVYAQDIAYHQDAFTLVTADLLMPNGIHFGKRESYEGISLRVVSDYDIGGDTMPTRIDVLGGWEVLRASESVRITN